MDELIDKSTFVERERKLDAVIREKETELLELSDIEEQERKKKEVKATFGLIARSNDLYEAFKLLISRIEVTKDGVVSIFIDLNINIIFGYIDKSRQVLIYRMK